MKSQLVATAHGPADEPMGGLYLTHVAMSDPDLTARVIDDVLAERAAQDARWGKPTHDIGTWFTILQEELGEAAAEQMGARSAEPGAPYRSARAALRHELVQATAVLVAMIEAIDDDRASSGMAM